MWELAADTLDYQCGRPGQCAVYTIETVADGLRFTLDADDADDKPIHHVYGGKLDGGDVLMPNTALTLSLEKLDESTIQSTLKKDGLVLDR